MVAQRQSPPVHSTDLIAPYEARLRAFFQPRGIDVDAQAIGFLMYRTETDFIAAIESQALRPLGLTHASFVLLMTLWIYGPTETRVLARVQRVSRPTIVSNVNTLERAALVRRVRSNVDRRLVTVELTATGRRAIERAQRRVNEVEGQLAAVLTRDEQKTLARLLRKFNANVRDTGYNEDA